MNEGGDSSFSGSEEEPWVDSEEEEHLEFVRTRVKDFTGALRTFVTRRKEFEEASLAFDMLAADLRMRGNWFCQDNGYEGLLIKLAPVGTPMGSLHQMPKIGGQHNVLETFLDVVKLGWRLWPDASTGMLMNLEWIAEQMENSDIALFDPDTIRMLKEMSLQKTWPNNPMCGGMTPQAAKTILSRHSQGTGFSAASTNGLVRAMAMCDEMGKRKMEKIQTAARGGRSLELEEPDFFGMEQILAEMRGPGVSAPDFSSPNTPIPETIDANPTPKLDFYLKVHVAQSH